MNSSALLDFYDGDHERVGFVLKSGKIVECQNIAEDPANAFKVSAEEIMLHADKAIATWHTHPNADNNLSANDYEMFVNWGDLDHYIVGTDGVRHYQVHDGDVLIA